ncbi:glycosyltransferase family 2 protein [Neomicrococcus lactis]|uniref:Glycosyltransferase involved in cell wall biosynthesis n=1 Tax=Neomicrococcus lactis TaxID=732241 RepID=A0A7W8YAY9_9MICC|nr:glycosyltransferase [Neomicrococcus lactis]MBB5598208.1 glycosyltransferase involved in cell wall biosynthesis [Neomicrococcus lactis]
MSASEEPKVSVVIPCFNAERTIADQLEALETQKDAPKFEVLIIDNGSTDKSREIVQNFAKHASVPFRVIEAHSYQGASYARNVGVSRSIADRIMFCDADDVVSQWWISHGNQCFERSPVWNGAAILLSDKQFEGTVDQIRAEFGDSPVFEEPVAAASSAFPVLMGGNFGATKSVLQEVQGFDQSFFGAGEDNDLGFRLRKAGYAYPNAPSVRIGYRGKWDSKFIRKLAFRQAKAHTLIATRYEAWSESPMPRVHRELVRVSGSTILMALGKKERNWSGLSSRAAILAGLIAGKTQYKVFGRIPQTLIGVGMNDEDKGSQP